MDELLCRCVVQVDVVAINVGGASFIQVTFSFGASKAVQDCAKVGVLLNLAQVKSHELISPVIAHSTLN